MRIHNPHRYISKRPWAIDEAKGAEILEFLDLRADGQERTEEEIEAIARGRRESVVRQASGVAVIPMFGVIAPRMDAMTAASGGMACDNFAARFDQAMANDEVDAIVIHIDSPGGSVQGVDELAARIFEARGKKRIVAVADGLMASAAYWIGSAADEIVVTPSGKVGSIGVFAVHTEVSKAEEEAGIKRTIVRAGRFKAEGNPHEPLSEEAQQHIQEDVNAFFNMFVEAVARNRGVSAEEVVNGFGQGRALTALRAVQADLVDRIGTLESVLAEFGISPSQVGATRADDEAPDIGTLAPAAAAPGVGEYAVYLPDVARALEDASPTITAGVPGDTAAESLITPAIEPPSGRGVSSMEPKSNGSEPHSNGDGSTAVTAVVNNEAERSRAGTIADLCSFAGVPDRAGKFIQSQSSVDDVREVLRAEAESNLEAMTAPLVDMSEQEVHRYSLCRAIMGNAEQGEGWSGFEREVSDEIQSKMPGNYKGHGGIFVPVRRSAVASDYVRPSTGAVAHLESLIRASGGDPVQKARMLAQVDTMRAALDGGTATAGQELLFTAAGDFIDLLRARMKVAQLGATILTGLVGNVAFPRQTGAGTFSWVAEDPGSDLSDSDMTLAQVALNAKTGQSSTAYSRQLLNQGIVDVDNLVKNDLALITALGIDLAAINGSGASNQPTGVINTSGIGDVAIGTNGGAPTYAHCVDLETDVATANADIGSMAYLTTPGVRGKLKKTEEFGSSNGRPVWTGGMEGEVNGYPAHVSTQVPSTLTKGTLSGAAHAIVFGVWAQLMIGHWGAYELVVDPYTKKKQGLIELTSFQQAGIAVRNPAAFSAVLDADIS